MRIVVGMLLVLVTVAARAMAPRAACWAEGGATHVAALADGWLRLAVVTADGLQDDGAFPADGVTTLAVGHIGGAAVLLGGRGTALVRFDLPRHAWVSLGAAPAPVLEVLPLPDGSSGALLLTGTAGDPAPADGAVWRATWEKAFACIRITEVKDTFRPWQLWWTRAAGEQRLAAATYKATPFAPFEHNCMFLFAWRQGMAEKRWLGSRLTRPYVDATHADLHGDDNWRMAAVEVTRDGGRALSVYRPIGFGYESEWRTEAIAGLERVAAYGDAVLCWGHDTAGNPTAWRLLPHQDGYRLAPLPAAPPVPEGATRLDAGHLAGWWQGKWQVIGVE